MEINKPYVKFNKDKTQASVFIKGPIEPIWLADLHFDKNLVSVFEKITSQLLYEIYVIYNRLERDLKSNKGANNEPG